MKVLVMDTKEILGHKTLVTMNSTTPLSSFSRYQ
jgi:hypothetical protein